MLIFLRVIMLCLIEMRFLVYKNLYIIEMYNLTLEMKVVDALECAAFCDCVFLINRGNETTSTSILGSLQKGLIGCKERENAFILAIQ